MSDSNREFGQNALLSRITDLTTELDMMRKAWTDLRDSLVELDDETTVCVVELMDSLMVIAE